jgi:hypothetical protein
MLILDASHPLPGLRFLHVLDSVCRGKIPLEAPSWQETRNPVDLLENLDHFSTPTLAHLLALFSNQTACHPPPNTSLIVIDSFSTLVSSAFPRNADLVPPANKRPGGEISPQPGEHSLRRDSTKTNKSIGSEISYTSAPSRKPSETCCHPQYCSRHILSMHN